MVYYRKYRPQTINDLDKEDVKVQLRAIFSRKDIPHAFLFVGPKGTGKTSTARIVAKIVNCEKLEVRNLNGDIEVRSKDNLKFEKSNLKPQTSNQEPCNKCPNCLAITNGSHVDVLEIDAASNRGIDEIRALRDTIAFSPAMGKKKVYIIDEVHMLTKEAFNALLKTLEEPPPHVVFILATTERHKVPETILSRCTVIQFTKANASEIARSLGRIVTAEKLAIDEKSLISIAQSSDGSFRDAAKLLEQRASGIEVPVNNSVAEFMAFLIKKNTKEAFAVLESLEKNGSDFQDFTKQVLDSLHNELRARYSKEEKKTSPLSSLSQNELKQLLTLFSKALNEIKTSYIEQLPLELAVIEWTEKKLRVTS